MGVFFIENYFKVINIKFRLNCLQTSSADLRINQN